jgi:ferritin-like metal-binding protein YciE
MPYKNPREVFVLLLSDLRQSSERTAAVIQEMQQNVKDPDIREALEARAFVSSKIVDTLDECFRRIGEKPVKLSGRLPDVFMEDFRRELAEIQSPEAKHLFIMARALHVIHVRIAEYVTLIAAADITGHDAVGVLLESCLADHVAFVDSARRLIREKLLEKVAAA